MTEVHAGGESDTVANTLLLLSQQVTALNDRLGEIHSMLVHQKVEKEWYTTTELAEAMGVSQYTVQERWCNSGRIACEKDSDTAKWRIPGTEYRRLVAGGALRPCQT